MNLPNLPQMTEQNNLLVKYHQNQDLFVLFYADVTM
jgi:hypothetical protein